VLCRPRTSLDLLRHVQTSIVKERAYSASAVKSKSDATCRCWRNSDEVLIALFGGGGAKWQGGAMVAPSLCLLLLG
jgi:hypothetical protein